MLNRLPQGNYSNPYISTVVPAAIVASAPEPVIRPGGRPAPQPRADRKALLNYPRPMLGLQLISTSEPAAPAQSVPVQPLPADLLKSYKPVIPVDGDYYLIRMKQLQDNVPKADALLEVARKRHRAHIEELQRKAVTTLTGKALKDELAAIKLMENKDPVAELLFENTADLSRLGREFIKSYLENFHQAMNLDPSALKLVEVTDDIARRYLAATTSTEKLTNGDVQKRQKDFMAEIYKDTPVAKAIETLDAAIKGFDEKYKAVNDLLKGWNENYRKYLGEGETAPLQQVLREMEDAKIRLVAIKEMLENMQNLTCLELEIRVAPDKFKAEKKKQLEESFGKVEEQMSRLAKGIDNIKDWAPWWKNGRQSTLQNMKNKIDAVDFQNTRELGQEFDVLKEGYVQSLQRDWGKTREKVGAMISPMDGMSKSLYALTVADTEQQKEAILQLLNQQKQQYDVSQQELDTVLKDVQGVFNKAFQKYQEVNDRIGDDVLYGLSPKELKRAKEDSLKELEKEHPDWEKKSASEKDTLLSKKLAKKLEGTMKSLAKELEKDMDQYVKSMQRDTIIGSVIAGVALAVVTWGACSALGAGLASIGVTSTAATNVAMASMVVTSSIFAGQVMRPNPTWQDAVIDGTLGLMFYGVGAFVIPKGMNGLASLRGVQYVKNNQGAITGYTRMTAQGDLVYKAFHPVSRFLRYNVAVPTIEGMGFGYVFHLLDAPAHRLIGAKVVEHKSDGNESRLSMLLGGLVAVLSHNSISGIRTFNNWRTGTVPFNPYELLGCTKTGERTYVVKPTDLAEKANTACEVLYNKSTDPKVEGETSLAWAQRRYAELSDLFGKTKNPHPEGSAEHAQFQKNIQPLPKKGTKEYAEYELLLELEKYVVSYHLIRASYVDHCVKTYPANAKKFQEHFGVDPATWKTPQDFLRTINAKYPNEHIPADIRDLIMSVVYARQKQKSFIEADVNGDGSILLRMGEQTRQKPTLPEVTNDPTAR